MSAEANHDSDRIAQVFTDEHNKNRTAADPKVIGQTNDQLDKPDWWYQRSAVRLTHKADVIVQ